MLLENDIEKFWIARKLLRRNSIDNFDMEMVLFAMLMRGVSYSEAVQMWTQFSGKTQEAIVRALDEVARAADHESGARVLLNDLYREEVVRANGVRFTEGS